MIEGGLSAVMVAFLLIGSDFIRGGALNFHSVPMSLELFVKESIIFHKNRETMMTQSAFLLLSRMADWCHHPMDCTYSMGV
jgi:hypothetical protein